MTAKELRSLALSAMDYDSCTDEMIDTMATCILDTFRDDDDEPLTAKSVLSHPGYDYDVEVCYSGPKFSHRLGDYDLKCWDEEAVDFCYFSYQGNELYPQPTTWGELRYLAKMLNAKLESV